MRGGLDRDDIRTTNLSPKFRMANIERYSKVGDPKGHLRLYSHIMRAHRLDYT